MTSIDLEQFFQGLAGKSHSGMGLDFDATIQLHLDGVGGGDWSVAIRDGKVAVSRGTAADPDATLDTSADEFVRMLAAPPEEIGWAFMQGRFNMSGNIRPLWRVLGFLRTLNIGP